MPSPYIQVTGVHPVCEGSIDWDAVCRDGDKKPVPPTGEFGPMPSSARERLLATTDGKGGNGTRTFEGKREIRARVGPWMAFKMLFTGYINPKDSLRFKHMLADYDDPADPEETTVVVDATAEEVVRKPRHSNANWWAAYSLLAHAKHHSPKFTRANEMIVSSWIQKNMEADGVRKLDVAKVLPLAVRFAFVPTEADIDSFKVDNAPAVKRRYKKRETKYWTNFFGLPRGHYESDR